MLVFQPKTLINLLFSVSDFIRMEFDENEHKLSMYSETYFWPNTLKKAIKFLFILFVLLSVKLELQTRGQKPETASYLYHSITFLQFQINITPMNSKLALCNESELWFCYHANRLTRKIDFVDIMSFPILITVWITIVLFLPAGI